MKKKFLAGVLAAGLSAGLCAIPAEARCESVKICPYPANKHAKKITRSKIVAALSHTPRKTRTLKAKIARTKPAKTQIASLPKAKIAAWPKATAEQTARAAAITPPPIQTGGVHQTERVHYVFNAPVRQRRMPAKPTEATRTVAVKHARGRSITVKHARGGSIVKMIEAMAPQYGVPTWFALRIAKVESGYNPNARGSHGELGVFQMKCATARGIGYNGGCEGLLNAHTGIQYGLKHLSLALKSSRGNLRLAASKHNGGLGRRTLVPTYVAQVF